MQDSQSKTVMKGSQARVVICTEKDSQARVSICTEGQPLAGQAPAFGYKCFLQLLTKYH
jgi:hypothetical protein